MITENLCEINHVEYEQDDIRDDLVPSEQNKCIYYYTYLKYIKEKQVTTDKKQYLLKLSSLRHNLGIS